MDSTKKIFSSIYDVKLVDFQFIKDSTGELAVIEEGTNLPIAIKRVFLVNGQKGVKRGMHAHRLCNQVLVCVSGICKVYYDDGVNTNEVVLDRLNIGLHVPPGIWAEQVYEQDNTQLLVFCDQFYDETDYIRDYKEYTDYREGSKMK